VISRRRYGLHQKYHSEGDTTDDYAQTKYARARRTNLSISRPPNEKIQRCRYDNPVAQTIRRPPGAILRVPASRQRKPLQHNRVAGTGKRYRECKGPFDLRLISAIPQVRVSLSVMPSAPELLSGWRRHGPQVATGTRGVYGTLRRSAHFRQFLSASCPNVRVRAQQLAEQLVQVQTRRK